MSFNILIPELNSKPKNSKDAIINILTLEWPLGLKQIYHRIRKQYNYTFTYQSVYKAVKELCNVKVLKSKDKKYEINVEWIKRVQSFTDIVETNYYAKERLQSLSGLKDSKLGEDIMILNFETIFDAEKYLYYFMKQELFKGGKETVCLQLNNEWRPLFYLRAEYNYYKRLIEKQHKFYFICSGNSYLETISKKFYQSLGVRYKTSSQNLSNDTLIFKDYFIQIFIPENLKNKMKKYLDKKNLISLLKEVLEKKSQPSIRVVINKDKALANEIKKQIIKRF